MKTDLHPCYVLHTRPYKESSLLVDILSREYGQLRLVAKGVKRPKNNKSVLLQPGIRLLMSWSQRGAMGNLINVEDSGTRYQLGGRKIIICFYINELLIRLLHAEEPHPEIFDYYQQALEDLVQQCDEQKILRIFEKKLLQEMGYGLVLDHDAVTGEPIDELKDYYYVIESGPRLDKSSSADSIKVSGKALIALNNEQEWNDDIARQAKQLLRMVLKEHAGDKSFGSRDLYRAYLQNVKGA